MKLIKSFIVLAAVLLIQTMVLDRYKWLQLIDLFLLFNIYFALNSNQMVSMATSIPSGLVQDAFSKGIIGINAFSKTIIVFFISGLSSRLMLKHPFLILLIIALATVIDYFIILGLYMLFGLPPFQLTGKMLAIAAMLNSGIGMISFQIVDRIRMKKQYA